MLLNLVFSILLSVGVPNISGASTASTTNYLSVKKGYVMSYNGVEGRANWVGWTLSASDVGSVERTNRFIQDESFPRGFRIVDERDYTHSGFDRGHLCNSEDRTSSYSLNVETFLMSNMIPQTPELNRGPFKFLEECLTKLYNGNRTQSKQVIDFIKQQRAARKESNTVIKIGSSAKANKK